jgi:ABC-type uncharacterized transport system involved in gliding motility auxiliary subunit
MGKFKINKRSLKYGSNSIILIAIVVAITVVINLLVGMGEFKWDLTSDKLYSLSDESKKILKDVKKDVTIYGLFDDGKVPTGNEYKEIINLIGQYEKNGIDVKYIDPNKDPGTITEFEKQGAKDIKQGDFAVKCGNKVKKLLAADLYGETTDYGRLYQAEPLITGAIKFVTSDVTPRAYFVEGHSEYSVDKEMTQIKGEIENNNFEVQSLSLLTTEKIPDDCKLLLFASPKQDLSDTEKIKLNKYLENGGKAIFMFDPIESSTKLTNFEEVLSKFNIGINYDEIKETDSSRYIPGDEYSIIAALETNTINDALNCSGIGVFLPNSRSLSILKNSKDYLTTTSLINTTDKAVSTSIADKNTTENGPFDLAIASEISGSTKILAFGNASFLTDAALSGQYASYFSNGKNFFLSAMVNWMQGKSDDTAISAKLVTTKALTTTSGQTKVISIALIGVVPVIILICGLVVWSRRRHL